MFENEEWKPIETLPHYWISNYGRVKREDSIEARKVQINDRGFPVVLLYGQDSKTRYMRQINKLVAEAFVPKPFDINPRWPENAVWHKDGDLTNCNAENLEWRQRGEVLEWNEMHRTGRPKYRTRPVRNNRTGAEYANAFECAMAEGVLESKILWRIERQARHEEDDLARYRYISRKEFIGEWPEYDNGV